MWRTPGTAGPFNLLSKGWAESFLLPPLGTDQGGRTCQKWAASKSGLLEKSQGAFELRTAPRWEEAVLDTWQEPIRVKETEPVTSRVDADELDGRAVSKDEEESGFRSGDEDGLGRTNQETAWTGKAPKPSVQATATNVSNAANRIARSMTRPKPVRIATAGTAGGRPTVVPKLRVGEYGALVDDFFWWHDEDEALGTAELREPWRWGEDVAEAEAREGSTRGPAGQDLVEALHDLAQRLQSDLFDHEPLAPGPWYAPRWLGIDRNFWMCTLGYQGAVLALLRAVVERAESSSSEKRGAFINVSGSLRRQCEPLEACIRDALGSRHIDVEAWFLNRIDTTAMESTRELLDKDPFFWCSAFSDWDKGLDPDQSRRDNDVNLITMALHAQGAMARLGPEAVSCTAFSSCSAEETNSLFVQLAAMLPIDVVYAKACRAGLRREFLSAFGKRAAGVEAGSHKETKRRRVQEEENVEEMRFWVQTVEGLLRVAMEREGVYVDWARANVPGAKEAIKEELAVFGFFVALGRSTRMFLASKGAADTDKGAASLVRYLEGASVLFYPELTNLLRFQLFVDVVCEEMAWLPFYPGVSLRSGVSWEEAGREKPRITKRERRHGLAAAERTCAHWLEAWTQHSSWGKERPDSKAAHFIRDSRRRLAECILAREQNKQARAESDSDSETSQPELGDRAMELELVEMDLLHWQQEDHKSISREAVGLHTLQQEWEGFTKELATVEETLNRLERLAGPCEGPAGSMELVEARPELAKLQRLRGELKALGTSFKVRAAEEEEERLTEAQQLGVKKGQKERESRDATEEQSGKRGFGNLEGSGGDEGQRKLGRSMQLVARWRRSVEGAVGAADTLMESSSPIGPRAPPAGPLLERSNSSRGRNGRRWRQASSALADPAKRGLSRMAIPEEGDEEGGLGMEKRRGLLRTSEALRLERLKEELSQLEAQLSQPPPEIEDSVPPGKTGPRVSSLRRSFGLRDRLASFRSNPDSESARSELLSDWNEEVEAPGAQTGIVSKSVEALKETSANAWRGTQLLSTDLVVALAMLQRGAQGRHLTGRERKILRRTLVDVAAVIPIGILMLIPMTPVGHGALLAAIQKWCPWLIPSSFGAERLDVAKQLEGMRLLTSDSSSPKIPPVESTFQAASVNRHLEESGDEDEEEEEGGEDEDEDEDDAENERTGDRRAPRLHCI